MGDMAALTRAIVGKNKHGDLTRYRYWKDRIVQHALAEKQLCLSKGALQQAFRHPVRGRVRCLSVVLRAMQLERLTHEQLQAIRQQLEKASHAQSVRSSSPQIKANSLSKSLSTNGVDASTSQERMPHHRLLMSREDVAERARRAQHDAERGDKNKGKRYERKSSNGDVRHTTSHARDAQVKNNNSQGTTSSSSSSSSSSSWWSLLSSTATALFFPELELEEDLHEDHDTQAVLSDEERVLVQATEAEGRHGELAAETPWVVIPAVDAIATRWKDDMLDWFCEGQVGPVACIVPLEAALPRLFALLFNGSGASSIGTAHSSSAASRTGSHAADDAVSSLAIHYLQMTKEAIVVSLADGRKGLKLVRASPDHTWSVTNDDKSILALKCAVHRMEARLSQLTAAADECKMRALACKRAGQDDRAKLWLGRRLMHLKQMETGDRPVLRLHQILDAIADAHTNQQVVAALSNGNAVLKELTSDERLQLEHVTDVTDEAKMLMEDQQRIDEALRQGSGALIGDEAELEAELEAEFAALLAEEPPHEPSASSTTTRPVTKEEPSDDDITAALERRLAMLRLADAPKDTVGAVESRVALTQ